MPKDGYGLPLASTTLALTMGFDLSGVTDWQSMRERDCGAALETALAKTNLRKQGTVAARSITTSGPATVTEAHALPLEGDAWASDASAHPIRIEFLWSTSMPAMAMRVLNELSYPGGGCDGVTSLRVAMHVLEALEGGAEAVATCAPFKKTPPFSYGAQHVLNALRRIPIAIVRGNWPWYPEVSAEELAAPSTSAGLRAYYYGPNAAAAKPARFRGYAAPPGASKSTYKALLNMCQTWSDRVGFSEFFTLNNMSPMAAPCIVPRARDIVDTETRYANIFMPPGYPPGGSIWTGMSHLHVNSIFMNNYGTHEMSFKARMLAFSWDWTGMCAPAAGCGCITVNGQLCAWTRWTEAGLDRVDDIIRPVLGELVFDFDQIERS